MLQVVWYRDTATTTTTIVLRPFVRDYPGEPVPEETLTHPPSWSSSSPYQLLSPTTIHSILLFKLRAWQYFCTTSVHVLLVYLLVWSPPPHIPYISSPSQCLLFTTHDDLRADKLRKGWGFWVGIWNRHYVLCLQKSHFLFFWIILSTINWFFLIFDTWNSE